MYISEITTGCPSEERTDIENRVYALLGECGIEFERVDNESLSTMEECEAVSKVLGTDICKSILACTRNKSSYYLIIMPGDKRFVSKFASKAIGASRLSFASAEDMEELLGTSPGNASPLAAVNDSEGRVMVVIDKELAESEFIACNVGVNTTHIRMRTADLMEKYLPNASHEPMTADIREEE